MLVTISLTCLLAAALGEEKSWQWSNSFHPSSSCPGQRVVIPGAVVFLDGEVSLGQLELGVGGMLVLGEASSLSLESPASTSRQECLPPLTPVNFTSPPPGAWLDPANWRDGLTPRPHSEQVPCQHDRVVFPQDMTYLVSITESDVTVAQLSLAGRSLDNVGWRSIVRTEVGRRMFNVTREVSVTGSHCRDWRGCQCGTRHQEEIICSHAGGGHCQPPTCSRPLRPRGHCCYNYCGAVISLTSTAGMDTIRTVASHHSGTTSMVYVRRLEGYKYEILLVPSSGNLTATHEAAAHIQSYLMLELRSSVSEVWVEYSGAGPPPGPLARAFNGLGWLTLFSLVMAVGVFLNRRYSSVPLTQYRDRLEAQFSGFALFTNTGEGEVELRGIETEEVNQDAADGEMVKSEELIGGESSSRSFSNPMFNIEPPANLYSEEPTKDITFGVENPTYVALAELDKGVSLHYEVIDIDQDQANTEVVSGKTEELESETPVSNPETNEANNAESKTSSGGELLNINENKETEDPIANSANGIFEKKTGNNERLLQLSDMFENNQDKEEGNSADITISDIEE